MLAQRIAGLLAGLVFGLMLCWSGMTSPDVIRGALLFEQSYLFLFFASAVATAAVGLALVRRRERRALLTGARIAWKPEPVRRRHLVGSLVFGLGWGVSNACPGPVATQVTQGSGWALFTLAGIAIGVAAYLRREATETEPATDVVDAPEPSPAPA
jgi:uncharacterized membrane protein YedE/YeeE